MLNTERVPANCCIPLRYIQQLAGTHTKPSYRKLYEFYEVCLSGAQHRRYEKGGSFMTYTQAYQFGTLLPIAMKILQAGKTENELLFDSFMEYINKLNLNNPNGEDDMNYFASESFFNKVTAKLTILGSEIYNAWSLGRLVCTLDWMIEHNGKKDIIDTLKVQTIDILKSLSIDYQLYDTNKALVELKEILKKRDEEMKKPGKIVVNVDGKKHNLQIGNGNTQYNIEIALNELKEKIEQADASQKEKNEAKSLLQKLLEHPLVSAIVGGSIGLII